MNGIERVKAIIEGRPVDRCAYWTGCFHEETLKYSNRYFGTTTPEDIYRKLGDDVRWHPVGRGAFKGPIGLFADCENADEVFESTNWFDPDEFDFAPSIELIKASEGTYRFSGNLSMFYHCDCFSAFGGMQNYFLKMYTDPEVVHAVTRRANDYYLRENRRFFELAGDHFEAFKVSHDLGTQLNLLLSPDMLETFVFPYVKEQIDLGHEYGYDVLLHCCGAIKKILPRIIELGADLLHPIQALAAGMDADSIAEFKDRITFVGGIDTQHLLVHGSPADVRAEVHRVAGILGPFVISPSHELLLPNIPPENIEAIGLAVMSLAG